MSKSIQGIQSVALSDGLTGGSNYVLLDKVLSETNIESLREVTDTTTGNVAGVDGIEGEVFFSTSDNAVIEQLNEWSKADTELTITGFGSMCFYGAGLNIQNVRELTSNARDGVMQYRFQVVNYGPFLDFYSHSNYSKCAMIRPREGFPTISSYLAQRGNSSVSNWSEYGQIVALSTTGIGEYLFPFEGKRINVSMQGGTGASFRVLILGSAGAGSPLVSQDVDTGVDEVITVPAGAQRIRYEFNGFTGSVTISLTKA